MAAPRFFGGKATVIRESVCGIIKAPPIPCTTRETINAVAPEIPPRSAIQLDRPHNPEAAMKTAIPVTNIFLRPKMSPIRPKESISTAKARI
jgi:hypothetical protein